MCFTAIPEFTPLAMPLPNSTKTKNRKKPTPTPMTMRTTPVSCASSKTFQSKSAQGASSACWPQPRDGKTLATFRGEAEGVILDAPRGTNGFGYDPLFYLPQIAKTFAELTAQEKSQYSHRGAAFRQLLDWYLNPETK